MSYSGFFNYNCASAPACAPPQTRNPSTGACETLSKATPVKNNGTPSCGLSAGNPINIGTGNKYELESDYQGAGHFPLTFERYYNNDPSAVSVGFGAGSGWRHSYERSLTLSSASAVVAQRADGKAYHFSLAGTQWQASVDVNLQLSAIASGWQLTLEDGSIERYDGSGKLSVIQSRAGDTQTLAYNSNGRLASVTHGNGRTLTLSYDSQGRLSSLQDPAGGTYQYGYDSTGNLVSATYPDQTTRTYVYNETANVAVSRPHALTGLIDENNQRYATWRYDSQGRAIASEHAGGADATQVSYGTDSTTVTDALGAARTSQLQFVQGVVKSGGSSQPAGAGCSASASALTYDANGNVASRTDFNGNLSCYAYDMTRNLETARLEGLAPGSSCPGNIAGHTPVGSERLTTTQWQPGLRLPSQINEAGRQTTYRYDAAGNLLQKTVTDSATRQARTWTYTYTGNGQLLSADGPRTDVADLTTYTYYSDSTDSHRPGDLKTRTDALGHTTTYTAYDAHGRLLGLTDANGLTISLGYDARGRLTQKTVDGQPTRYRYDAAGNLTQIAWPTGATVSYSYDSAHRLTGITDTLGGSLRYTLDAMGNRTQDIVTDAQGNTLQSHRRVFDVLSRLQTSAPITRPPTSATTPTAMPPAWPTRSITGPRSPMTRSTGSSARPTPTAIPAKTVTTAWTRSSPSPTRCNTRPSTTWTASATG